MGGGGDTLLSLARWRQVHLTQLKSLPAMLVTQGGCGIMDSKALFLQRTTYSARCFWDTLVKIGGIVKTNWNTIVLMQCFLFLFFVLVDSIWLLCLCFYCSVWFTKWISNGLVLYRWCEGVRVMYCSQSSSLDRCWGDFNPIGGVSSPLLRASSLFIITTVSIQYSYSLSHSLSLSLPAGRSWAKIL